jgi:hypothetical protein
MARSVRLYTTAQVEEMTALIDTLAQRFDLPPAELAKLLEFQADMHQTVREDRRRAARAGRPAGSAAASS